MPRDDNFERAVAYMNSAPNKEQRNIRKLQVHAFAYSSKASIATQLAATKLLSVDYSSLEVRALALMNSTRTSKQNKEQS